MDGKVIISTLLNNEGLYKGLKGVSGAFGGLKKVVGGLAASITAAMGAAAVAITKQSVDAYADYQQLTGGMETMFKDSASKIAKYAEDAFFTAGVSSNEYMDIVTGFSASLISSLAGDTEAAADVADMALKDMSDNANKMGSTLQSVQEAYKGFSKQQYQLLDNLKLGYGGTKTEMERLLRDAQAYSGVKYDISNLSDVYKAIHVIQEKLGVTGTTAAEAEKTITGSANMTKAAWKNVLTAISGGGDLDKAINNLVYSLTKYFENIVPVVERSLFGIGRLIERIAPQLVETVAATLIKALPTLLSAVYQMIIGLASGIYQGIAALFSGKSFSNQITASLNKVGEGFEAAASGAEDLEKSTEAAGKAAKKSLAGFDELNTLTNNSSTGSSGVDNANGSVETTISSSATSTFGEEVDMAKIQKIASTIKDIAGYAPVIAAGFGGLKLGGFLADLLTANTEVKTLKEAFSLLGNKISLMSGITLSVAGITLETKGIISAIQESLNGTNFAEILLGGGFMTSGAALIGKFFAHTALGSAIGAIIAGIPMYITGIYDAIVNGLNWLNGLLIPIGSTLAFTGIGYIIGHLGGPIGAGVGALIGLCIGLLTDFGIWLWQNFEKIESWIEELPLWIKVIAGAIALIAAPIALSMAAFMPGMFLLPALITAVIVVLKKAGTVAESVKSFFQSVSKFCSDLWLNIKEKAVETWTKIKEFFQPAVQWFSELFSSVSQTLEDIFYNIGVIAGGCWEIIQLCWQAAKNWFNEKVVQPISQIFSKLWTGVKEWASDAWSSIKQVLQPISTWINTHIILPVTGLFKNLWTGFSKWASDAWVKVKSLLSDLGSFFKGILNGVIGLLNSGFSNTFGKINSILSNVKNLEIMGSRPFANLRTISVPQIPYLAKGAVLPANKPFMAVVGDQKHGTNVEAPLTVIQEAVAAVMQDYAASNMAGHEATVAVLRELLEAVLGISIGDEVIASAVQRYDRKMAVVRGGYV